MSAEFIKFHLARVNEMKPKRQALIFRIVELESVSAAVKQAGECKATVDFTWREYLRKLLIRVPSSDQQTISNRAQAGETFQNLAKAFKLGIAEIKAIVRSAWNAANAALSPAESTKMGGLDERVELAMEYAIAAAANDDNGVLRGDAIKFKKGCKLDGEYGFEASHSFPRVSRAISDKFTEVVDRTRQYRRNQRIEFARRTDKSKLEAHANADRLYRMAAQDSLDDFQALESTLAT
jgi:hypothetical protein